MKINPANDVATPTPAPGAPRTERGAATTAAVGEVARVAGASPAGAHHTSPGVPVTVSAAVRSLEGVSAGSGIDEAKVATVRAAIANGTFQVNAGVIADKLLANAQEVLSRSRN
jgi:negative regulator of flagellin synthesis FlgM